MQARQARTPIGMVNDTLPFAVMIILAWLLVLVYAKPPAVHPHQPSISYPFYDYNAGGVRLHTIPPSSWRVQEDYNDIPLHLGRIVAVDADTRGSEPELIKRNKPFAPSWLAFNSELDVRPNIRAQQDYKDSPLYSPAAVLSIKRQECTWCPAHSATWRPVSPLDWISRRTTGRMRDHCARGEEHTCEVQIGPETFMITGGNESDPPVYGVRNPSIRVKSS